MKKNGHDGERLPNGARRCVARTKHGPNKGKRCGKPALTGATCCKSHLKNQKAVENAQVRREVNRWVPGDPVDDPGDTLLVLLSQSRERLTMFGEAVAGMVEAAGGDLQRALVGNVYTTTADGDTVKIGEYLRAMLQAEERERERCGRFAELAIRAGIAERETDAARRLGGVLTELLADVLTDLQVPDHVIAQVPAAVERHLVAAG